jgi:hypothetical protein
MLPCVNPLLTEHVLVEDASERLLVRLRAVRPCAQATGPKAPTKDSEVLQAGPGRLDDLSTQFVLAVDGLQDDIHAAVILIRRPNAETYGQTGDKPVYRAVRLAILRAMPVGDHNSESIVALMLAFRTYSPAGVRDGHNPRLRPHPGR